MFWTRINGHRQGAKKDSKEKPIVEHASAHTQYDFNNCFFFFKVNSYSHLQPISTEEIELSLSMVTGPMDNPSNPFKADLLYFYII